MYRATARCRAAGSPAPLPHSPVLPQLFQKHVDTYGLGSDPIEFICGPFYSIRLLARRFALTLGFDSARDAAHLIHRCMPGGALTCPTHAPARATCRCAPRCPILPPCDPRLTPASS